MAENSPNGKFPPIPCYEVEGGVPALTERRVSRIEGILRDRVVAPDILEEAAPAAARTRSLEAIHDVIDELEELRRRIVEEAVLHTSRQRPRPLLSGREARSAARVGNSKVQGWTSEPEVLRAEDDPVTAAEFYGVHVDDVVDDLRARGIEPSGWTDAEGRG